jgi:hypothetical protein
MAETTARTCRGSRAPRQQSPWWLAVALGHRWSRRGVADGYHLEAALKEPTQVRLQQSVEAMLACEVFAVRRPAACGGQKLTSADAICSSLVTSAAQPIKRPHPGKQPSPADSLLRVVLGLAVDATDDRDGPSSSRRQGARRVNVTSLDACIEPAPSQP